MHRADRRACRCAARRRVRWICSTAIFSCMASLSLTLVNTTDNNFFGQSDDQISKDFSEVGLNASWRLTPDLQLSAEVLSRRAGETDDGACGSITAWSTGPPCRASRDAGSFVWGGSRPPMACTTRRATFRFTRPSIILPQSIYFERTRNLTVSADGAEIYVERYGEAGYVCPPVLPTGLPDRYRRRQGAPGRPESAGQSGFQTGSRSPGHVRGVWRPVSPGFYHLAC